MKNAFVPASLALLLATPAALVAQHFGLGLPAWLLAEHVVTAYVGLGLAALVWHDYAPCTSARKSAVAKTAARAAAPARRARDFALDATLASTVVPL